MQPGGERMWTLAHEPEGPLEPYLDSFAESLNAQGFKQHLLSRQVRDVAAFSFWLHAQQISAEAVTDGHAQAFLDRMTPQHSSRQGAAAVLRRLMNFLRDTGAICGPMRGTELTPVQRHLADFVDYLQHEQGVSAGTIAQYRFCTEGFLPERFGKGRVDLASLRAAHVIGFIQRRAARLSPARAKAETISLRAYLRFARCRGEIHLDLAAAVPTVPNWAMTAIPRAISYGIHTIFLRH